MSDANAFLEARNQLLNLREDYATALGEFRWPSLTHFNWALDYFDTIGPGHS